MLFCTFFYFSFKIAFPLTTTFIIKTINGTNIPKSWNKDFVVWIQLLDVAENNSLTTMLWNVQDKNVIMCGIHVK